MKTLTITSVDVNELDLNNVNETVRVYSASIDGRAVSIKWVTVVPSNATADTTNRTDYKGELTAVGYTWDAEV